MCNLKTLCYRKRITLFKIAIVYGYFVLFLLRHFYTMPLNKRVLKYNKELQLNSLRILRSFFYGINKTSVVSGSDYIRLETNHVFVLYTNTMLGPEKKEIQERQRQRKREQKERQKDEESVLI